MNRPPRHQQPGLTQKSNPECCPIFLVLALVAVAMVGAVAYIRGRSVLQEAVYSQLRTTATLKQQEISRWLEACEGNFLLIASFPSVQQEMQTLFTHDDQSPAYQAAYQQLSDYLAEVQKNKPQFTEISIQNRANRIILSTNPDLVGTYEIATNLTELESIVPGSDFTPNFYVSPEDGKPALTYSRKIFDDEQTRQGMILANLDLQRIDEIVLEGSSAGLSNRPRPETSIPPTSTKIVETYLVGYLANKTAFLSRRETEQPLPGGPQSEGITAAFGGVNGEGIYDNYRKESVIGVYRWLEGQEVVLLAEMSAKKAFEPARELAATIVSVGLGAAGILFLGVSRLARQLSFSRRQIERYSQQLEETAAAANAANQAKSEFLANMSHELRTPLNAILGFTQLMQRHQTPAIQPVQNGVHQPAPVYQREYQNEYQQEYLGIISRSGEHLLNLINDVLSMAKIESGQTTFDPTSFDLHYLLLTLEEMLRMRAEAKTLQLFVEVGEMVPQFIKTDEVKLRQVLVNLVGNAIKFTQVGNVTLAVSVNDSPPHRHRLFFSVVDTGPGIAKTELSHLFDPFFQAAKTRSAQQGTGLGLAISQQFVQLMGGSISVQSEPGCGATFSFDVPVLPAEETELPTAPSGEVIGLAPGQPIYRILVVDDILSSRQLLVELLILVGFQVKAVGDGKAAIAAYQSWQPDLIWMDMRMPVLDGYEATRQIRAMGDRQTKVIAVTASAFEEERTAVLACGCDDFVRKPFPSYLIFEKMREHLGVQYRYQTDEVELSDPEDIKPLQPEDLAAMPTAWLAKFHQAATAVDADQLHQLIAQIPSEQSHLVTPLSVLTDNFGFDELIALTQIYA